MLQWTILITAFICCMMISNKELIQQMLVDASIRIFEKNRGEDDVYTL